MVKANLSNIKLDEIEKARIDYYENKIEMLIRTHAENINHRAEEVREIVAKEFNRLRDIANRYEGTQSYQKWIYRSMAVRDVLKLIDNNLISLK